MNTAALNQGHWQANPGKLALRETEACLCVANGATNKMGAREMGVSISTFSKNLQRAMYKLNTYTRAETIAEAIRQGIITTLLLIITLQSVITLDDPMLRTRTRLRPMRITRTTKTRTKTITLV